MHIMLLTLRTSATRALFAHSSATLRLESMARLWASSWSAGSSGQTAAMQKDLVESA